MNTSSKIISSEEEAALALEGSTRKTLDIGILIPAGTANFIASSASGGCLVVKDRGLYLAAESSHIPIDVLTKTAGELSYEDLMPHTHSADGTPTLSLPTALGVKIKTWYSRQDTTEGCIKQSTDPTDIGFLCNKMKRLGQRVSLEATKMFPVGCYTMLLITIDLKEEGYLDDFEDVGGSFLSPGARTRKSKAIL